MGQKKGSYNPEFLIGSKVRITENADLQDFLKNWKYHHPLQEEQLKFGGIQTTVRNVTFYHGGDELYELSDVPGFWHEECFRSSEE